MTLCTPIGAGQMLCWMHVLKLGLDPKLDPEPVYR
jgi:hypothetical protein